MEKKLTLRQSMDYLHTWAGVLFSVLLFLVFFMGTLSVFDREIDRWMMPDTRLVAPEAISFSHIAQPHLQQLAPEARLWSILYPSQRDPVMQLGWSEAEGIKTRFVNAATGELLAEAGSKGATGFFYPFHYSFHLEWMNIGHWLLAIVSMAMLVLLVTGIIIHKKIFADFFTFRPDKSMHRATLDLHNVSSVFLLPFHFMITFSGLIIFLFIYMKWGVNTIYDVNGSRFNQKTFNQEAFNQVIRPPSGQVLNALVPVDIMVKQAQGLWGSGEVHKIIIRNPRDKNATVEIQRRPDDEITEDTITVTFDGATGSVLSQQKLSSILRVQRFFSGLHRAQFDHWGLRWMYFVMGLISCVMIGTGLLLWVEKRRIRQEKEGRSSYRTVNAITVAGTLGLAVATLAMLIANKLFPADLANRAFLEQWAFFAAWFLMLMHAFARSFYSSPSSDSSGLWRAWREQAWAITGLAVLAVILNAAMTGDHLLHTLGQGRLAVAGVDLVLLAVALLAMLAAQRIRTGSGRPVPAALNKQVV